MKIAIVGGGCEVLSLSRDRSPYSSIVMHVVIKGYRPDMWHYLLITGSLPFFGQIKCQS
ncbi:MAG: hypothetical protein RMI93_02525 [Caldimicrobium sp.]|nr:hypothetical protein [Caldimicrobium sp.]MDW8182467.1 hypothetical protein [Caldimicrobium sp.]